MTMTMHAAQGSQFVAERSKGQASRCMTTAGTAFGAIVTSLLVWQERARQRRQLLALGDLALHDFAISRAEVLREADKPFWRE
jgi:uncharacterized protein YjiS (DUF1127 family)